MVLDKTPDAINSIIKTINPVHQALSRQNKLYNKYFLSFNSDISNFMKILNRLHKRKEAPSLYETLFKKNETKYAYEQDIHKTFKELRNMNTNKYIPKDLIDKFKFDMGVEEKYQKKKIFRKNKNKEMKNKIKFNDNYIHEIYLAPGRYDPKYNLIFKKTPNIYFDKSKKQKSSEIVLSKNEDEKENEKFKKTNPKEKNNINEKNFISFNRTDKFKKINPRMKPLNLKNDINQYTKIFSSSVVNFKSNKLLQNKINNVNLKVFDKTLTSNFSQRINLNKKNKISFLYLRNNDFNYISNKKNNTFNGEKMTLNTCKSSKNSNKKTFSFTKTKSRNKNLSELKPISTSYINSPKSGIYSPKEIRLKLENKKFQNFKKYAVSKIIRHYKNFSPKDYFIFDINMKNKTKDKKYLNNIYNKYSI